MADPLNDEGLELEFEDALPDVEDTPDGGAIITLGDSSDPTETDHFDNLAETLPESELRAMAVELIQKIERDAESRKQRVQQYEEGIRRTGLGDDAPGGAQFAGASKVVHPIITEACIDFSARIMKELMPFDGPVKDKVIGEPTEKKVQKAKRKSRFMNWQITEQMPEFAAELEQMETQVPLGGSQYFTLYYDRQLKRPMPEFVPIDDMLLPFATANFYSSPRKTRVLHLVQLEYERRVESGLYRDADLIPEHQEPEPNAAEAATQKVEGKSPSTYNEDGLRDIYECYTYWEFDGDDRAYPYIVSIDKATERVLAVYRNYYPDDEQCAPIDHIFEFDFIRWRGSYGIGVPHIAGGLAGAITGALRALLDSALINNMPTLLKLKGSSRGGETVSMNPTEVIEVDGMLSPDQDIRKTMMPVPFNPPSPVLFQLLGFLTEAAKGVVRTSLDNEAMDTNANTPVGTQLSRVEQGLVVFSSIFRRQYQAMNRVLRRLHEINRDWLHDMKLPELEDELFVEPSDFQGPLDVIPVANPTIYSEQQRLAQFSALQQRAALYPQFYKLPELERAFVKDVLKIPNGEKFINVPPEPERMTAPAENVALMSGNAELEVYPDQDDLAHLDTHLKFFSNPAMGGNPIVMMKASSQLLPHLFKHLNSYYTKQVDEIVKELALKAQMSAEAMGQPVGVMGPDQLMSAASEVAQQRMMEHPLIQQLTPFIQQLSQQLQANMPQDPDKMKADAARAESQRKLQESQQQFALDQANAKNDTLRIQMENAVAEKQLMLDKMAMDLESARQARQEAAEERQRQMDWFETQMRVHNEERSMALETQRQIAEQRAAEFGRQLAEREQLFQEKMAVLQLQLDSAKQRLEEFVANEAAEMDRERATQERIALASEVARQVTESTNRPRQRTVKLKKGEDGSIESAEIHEGEG